mgnify:CR=1 FL=1
MKTHRAIRFVMVATFLLMQIAFLTIIIKDKYETEAFSTIILTLLIALTMLIGYRYLDLHHEEYSYENILVVMWVPIGAVVCYIMSVYGGLGSVLSAGITGTLASFLPNLNKESDYLKQLPASIYCGVFIGMSSVEISPSIGFVIAAGIFASIFLMLSKNLFLGIGGKLGSVAFVGVVIVSLINTLSKSLA